MQPTTKPSPLDPCWWHGEERWPGQHAVTGAVAWFGGLGVLGATGDIDDILARILFGLAGTFSGWGVWRLAQTLPTLTARIGGHSVALAALAVGLGLAIGTFAGFIAAYFALLFVTPLGFALLGIGLLRAPGVRRWVKTIPLILAGAGVVLYGFHAVARDVWDPHDAFWLGILGTGWLLLGFARFPSPTRRLASTP